jgi:hyperosmotically inducible protein
MNVTAGTGNVGWLVGVAALIISTSGLAADEAQSGQSDLWLKARLVIAYTLNTHLNPFDIGVQVDHGVATLSGNADSDVERELAVAIAKGVDGIVEVRDEIRVEPETAGESASDQASGESSQQKFLRILTDATTTARVKSRLLWHSQTDGLDIGVDTDEGAVTLTGTVNTAGERELAEFIALDTAGAASVNNRIAVSAEYVPTAERIKRDASDVWITTKAKSLILFSKDAAGSRVDISTDGGIIHVDGIVRSSAQKSRIIRMLGDVAGVKGVEADLLVVGRET